MEPVHVSFYRFDRVNFCNDDIRSKSFSTHRNTLAAPAITYDNNRFAGNNQVRRTVNSVPHRLARTISVIEQVFAISIIYSHHWELQLAFLLHRFKTQNTGSRLFGSAADILQQVRTFRMNDTDQISAIINNEVRLILQCANHQFFIFLRVWIVFGKYRHAILNKRCANIILCRERVASGNRHFSSAGLNNLSQISGFRLQMQRNCYFQSFKRLLLFKLLADPAKHRHVGLHPVNFQMSFRS
ncbi:hypothetical protein D3C77_342910 [compost metagenome]